MYTMAVEEVKMNRSETVINCPEDDEGPPINYNQLEGGGIVLILVIVMVITLIGNSLVIQSVLTFRQLKTRTNYFVLSLGVADCFVAVLVMPFGAYNLYSNLRWELGSIMCRIAICLDVMLTTTSILHLSCLAMDRYFAICNPFFYHDRVTKKTVYCLIAGCWIVPMIISWIPIMNGWNEVGIGDIITCKTPPDGKACVFLVNRAYAILCSLIAFYVPTVFMILVNLRIYREARKQVQQIRSLEVASLRDKKRQKKFRQESKAAKTLSIIMGAFCVCWCPFFVCNILDPFIGYKIPFSIWQLAIWGGYCNSLLNPFLYYFFNLAFRKAFTKLLCCYKCRGINDSNSNYLTAVSMVSEWDERNVIHQNGVDDHIIDQNV